MDTEGGYDPAVWQQMGAELGLQGIHIPEEFGGQGFGFVELAIVFEEMGRRLLCSPYLATVALATNAILNAGTDAEKAALLPGIATGETIAALAFTEANGRWDADGNPLRPVNPKARIDAPELKARCDREARMAVRARDLLADFLAAGPIRLLDVSADKYFGRIVATVEIALD